MIIRDVMNSKSDWGCYAVHMDANDIIGISKWYAMESRVFSGHTGKNGKPEKGPLWFTNWMVFDLDFDQKHWPELDTNDKQQAKMDESLAKMRHILGEPMCVIKNKESYPQWVIQKYFTKNGEPNLPKKHGCQVVYELKESIQSQYVERVELFKRLRQKLSGMLHSDPCFKGNMFKNFYNSTLFDVEWHDEHTLLDIKELCERYIPEYDAELAWSLGPFERMDDTPIPKACHKAAECTVQWYRENLDTIMNGTCRQQSRYTPSSSRNETLFGYLRSLCWQSLMSENWEEMCQKWETIFGHCDIKEPLSESEWESVYQSVVKYREINGMFDGRSRVYATELNGYDRFVSKAIIDGLDVTRVKIHHKCNINPPEMWYKWNGSRTSDAPRDHMIRLVVPHPYRDHDWNLYDDHDAFIKSASLTVDSHKMASKILCNALTEIAPNHDPKWIIGNMRSLFIPESLNAIQKLLSSRMHNDEQYQLWDLQGIIRDALWMVHMAMVHSISRWRRDPIHNELFADGNECNNKQNSRGSRDWVIQHYGFDASESQMIHDIIPLLRREGLLKDNDKTFPVSYYRSLWGIRNSDVSYYVRKVKNALKREKMIEMCRELLSHSHSHDGSRRQSFTIDDFIICLFDDGYSLNIKSFIFKEQWYEYG